MPYSISRARPWRWLALYAGLQIAAWLIAYESGFHAWRVWVGPPRHDIAYGLQLHYAVLLLMPGLALFNAAACVWRPGRTAWLATACCALVWFGYWFNLWPGMPLRWALTQTSGLLALCLPPLLKRMTAGNAPIPWRKTLLSAAALLTAMALAGYWAATHLNLNPSRAVGQIIDKQHDVAVYYNGGVQHVDGRNLTADGYNLGLRYQCVEFVKRYYYQRFGHKMPNDKGHARDFFQPRLASGELNRERGLLQFRNDGGSLPQADDLVVFAPWLFNRYGHVAIVSETGPDFVEIVQQNPGPFGASRERMPLKRVNGALLVGHPRLLGWLRRPPPLADAPTEPVPVTLTKQEAPPRD